MVTLCLQVVQRLITAQMLDGKGAKYVVETMWMLMEANIEEVCVLCVQSYGRNETNKFCYR